MLQKDRLVKLQKDLGIVEWIEDSDFAMILIRIDLEGFKRQLVNTE